MKSNGWEARVLLVLLLTVLGSFAPQWNWWVGCLVGLGTGLLTVAIELLFVRLPIEDAFLIVAGAAAGVVAGLLIMLTLSLAGVKVAPVMVMVPAALGYAFAHVALVKGRKRGAPGIAPGGSSAPSGSRMMLLDSTALVDGRVADMALTGLLTGPFVVPAGTRASIDSMLKSKDLVLRGRARRSAETLERLTEAAGRTGGLEERDFGEPARQRNRMLEWLRREGATLLSSDPDFLDTAAREGVRVIRLNEVGAATKAVVLPGERIRIKPIRRGRNKGQAVGFLSDGTMVVVEEAEDMIGKTLEAVAHTTFRASGGTMVFATPAASDEEAEQRDQRDPGSAAAVEFEEEEGD